jgi:hypothetical protein
MLERQTSHFFPLQIFAPTHLLLRPFLIKETAPERRRLREASKFSAAAVDYDSDHYHRSLAYFSRFAFFA